MHTVGKKFWHGMNFKGLGTPSKKTGKFNDIGINVVTPQPPHPINDIYNDDMFPVRWTQVDPSLLASLMTNVTLTNICCGINSLKLTAKMA